MNNHKHTFPLTILFIIFLLSVSSTHPIIANTTYTHQTMEPTTIPYTDIITHGIQQILSHEKTPIQQITSQLNPTDLNTLQHWYQSHPQIEFASLIHTTLTIKFIDGTYILLLNPIPPTNPNTHHSDDIIPNQSLTIHEHTATLLNPAESYYGYRYCKRIINRLLTKGYNIIYQANEAVNLRYIEQNLSADILYMNTHAGYWDIDGDQHPDAVVIGTGEHWTNETPQHYQFEYENQMIVQGMVGENSYIAFTPALIDYFYSPGDFPNSLIYMATCHATYDDSMANSFLNAGASVYLGWTQNTVFWTNSITSVLSFRLFIHGFTVKQVCRLIRSGGFYNFILQSKLTYYGDGNHRIPR